MRLRAGRHAWLIALCLALGPFQAAAARPVHRADAHVSAYLVKTVLTLPGYTDARAVALGEGMQIAGDASRGAERRCLFYNGSSLVDITPSGWPLCTVAAMTRSGTIVGTVQSPDGSQGFVYRANRAYLIGSAASFGAVNERALAIGTKQDGTPGVYDAAAGAWLRIADRATNCEMGQPLALNERSVLGFDSCTGTPRLDVASGGRFVAANLPDGLVPARVLTAADELVLYDPSTTGHAYWWAPMAGKPPLDLGMVPGDTIGGNIPLAANAQGVVLGENPTQFVSWVWSAQDGMRDLELLMAPKTYFGLAPRDLNDAGNVLLQGFDFTSGEQVWLVLEPAG